jgi:hypothetical protein
MARRRRSPRDVRAWLEREPPLAELREAYPAEWEIVERELGEVAGRGTEALAAYATALSAPLPFVRGPARLKQAQDMALLSEQIRRVMAATALKTLCLAAATGITTGKVRFNLVNGYVAQKLLFAHDLERKPVAMFRFRLLWPLLWQRRLLMPLVQPKGIYCFYSRPLIRELAALIGDRPGLEIAAGDGTLSRFLADEGVQITATDDYSWQHRVRYAEAVLRQDAQTALRVHEPEVVICSWPPAGNTFERAVFRTDSVQLYVVVNSGSEFGSGNRVDYRLQTDFDLTEDPALSRLVLPPELESVVHIFRRRAVTN